MRTESEIIAEVLATERLSEFETLQVWAVLARKMCDLLSDESGDGVDTSWRDEHLTEAEQAIVAISQEIVSANLPVPDRLSYEYVARLANYLDTHETVE